MNDHIEAILFDIGGTLRGSKKKTDSEKIELVEGIVKILKTDIPPDQFAQLLTKRNDTYTHWSRETHIELDEVGQWTKWLLPDWPSNQIKAHVHDIHKIWRQATAVRPVFPATREVVLELFDRGYRLGVVSNTVSSTEVPGILNDLGISGCFEVVILSCVVGIRKPNPEILLEATSRMDINPEKCAYIGNKLDRDVDSSRKAGFSKSVILLDPNDDDQFTNDPALSPDHYINNLEELLDIFPVRHEKPVIGPIYNVSLSTMWANKFPSLVEFFEAARRLGFRKVELNHQIDSAMLAKVDLSQYRISSIHEPCPADISTRQLKDRGWMISALDEDCRREGVEAIKRSIDLAYKIGVGAIVVHSGMVSPDLSQEKILRELYEIGKGDTAEYQHIKQTMVEDRTIHAPPRVEAVRRSLVELLEHARLFKIRLGLENRFHYFDIPSPDEMSDFLKLAEPDHLGFIYDVGHAETLDRLGFFPHIDWLDRFSQRIIGVHLHDVKGVVDHLAPGLSDVDFDMIAPYLPIDAFRTCELQAVNSPEQVKNSLRFLADHGCIHQL